MYELVLYVMGRWLSLLLPQVLPSFSASTEKSREFKCRFLSPALPHQAQFPLSSGQCHGDVSLWLLEIAASPGEASTVKVLHKRQVLVIWKPIKFLCLAKKA